MSDLNQLTASIRNLARGNKLEAFGHQHIVLMPSSSSVKEDILMTNMSVPGLLTQMLGGLDAKDIFLVTDNLDEANCAADELLATVAKYAKS